MGRSFRHAIAEHTNDGVYLNFTGNEGRNVSGPPSAGRRTQNILPAPVSVPAARMEATIDLGADVTTR